MHARVALLPLQQLLPTKKKRQQQQQIKRLEMK